MLTWKDGFSTSSKLDGCTDEQVYPVLSSHYNVPWGLLLFTYTLSCKRASDGVSTWAKFDVHIYHGYPVIWKSILPFIMYYGSALLLFTRKLHGLQTFEHISALLAIKAWVFVKFHTHIY